jgi:hypothetical protein
LVWVHVVGWSVCGASNPGGIEATLSVIGWFGLVGVRASNPGGIEATCILRQL